MTTHGSQTISYDGECHPLRVDLSGQMIGKFAYDGDGTRRKRLDANGTIHYLGGYERNLSTVQAPTDVPMKYYHANLGGMTILVAFRKNGTLYYVGTDHLGGTTRVADASFNPLDQMRYTPFGVSRDAGSSLNTDHEFTSQVLDQAIGLYWYKARAYDPTIGRFCQPDTVVPGASDPQSLNRYSYAQNNPLASVDPTGHALTRVGGGAALWLIEIGAAAAITGGADLVQGASVKVAAAHAAASAAVTGIVGGVGIGIAEAAQVGEVAEGATLLNRMGPALGVLSNVATTIATSDHPDPVQIVASAAGGFVPGMASDGRFADQLTSNMLKQAEGSAAQSAAGSVLQTFVQGVESDGAQRPAYSSDDPQPDPAPTPDTSLPACEPTTGPSTDSASTPTSDPTADPDPAPNQAPSLEDGDDPPAATPSDADTPSEGSGGGSGDPGDFDW